MNLLFTAQYRTIAIGTFAISLVFSIWALAADDVINNDGVEYITAAKLYLEGKWVAAANTFKWPFYPALIAVISKLTTLEPESSAHILNALLTSLLCTAFVATVIELGGNYRHALAAALIILLAKLVNDHRSLVIRDPGYLAFYTIGCHYLFRWYNHNKTSDALKASVFAILSTLFRVEGAVFLALVPIFIFARRAANLRDRIAFVALALIAGSALAVMFSAWHLSLGGARASGSTRLEMFSNSLAQVVTAIDDMLHVINVDLLSGHHQSNAPAVLIATLVFILIIETLKNLTVWNAAIIGWSFRKRIVFPNRRCNEPWLILVVINIVVLCAFVGFNLFLSGRYTLSLSVTLLLVLPFGLVDLYNRWRRPAENDSRHFRWLYPAIVLIIIISGIEGLNIGTQKKHIKEAGLWIADNFETNDRLLTNNKILWYYADRPPEQRDVVDFRSLHSIVKDSGANNFDVVAIRIGADESSQRKKLNEVYASPPDKVFENAKGDSVLIYRPRQALQE